MSYGFPEREMLLAPWLKSSSINMLTAFRGTGKTWVALSIGLAVACGGQFLAFNAPVAKRVLYIDGEMVGSELQGRVRKLLETMPSLSPENFRIINPDLQEQGLPDLSTAVGQRVLDRWTAAADLIVVDNLSSLARSGIENDAESWNPVATWALRMRREGRAVLFIHHTGKGGKQRGTSKREDLLDTSILLEGLPDTTSGASFVWQWSKVRGLQGKDTESIQAALVTSPLGELRWSYRNATDGRLDEVRVLRAQGLTVREVAAQLSLSRSTAGRLFKLCAEKC